MKLTKDLLVWCAGAASGIVIGQGFAAPNGSLWNLAAACVCGAWVIVLCYAMRPIR